MVQILESAKKLRVSVKAMMDKHESDSLITQKITEDISALTDSVKDRIDPSKQDDFSKGVSDFIYNNLQKYLKKQGVPSMRPLLQYNFYDGYRI